MSERTNITDIVARWLRLWAVLNRHPEGMARFDVARAVEADERTLRRDIDRMNVLAARCEPSLPFRWPEIETTIVARRAYLRLAGAQHAEGPSADRFTAVALRVTGELARRPDEMWPGPGAVERERDSARVALFMAGEMDEIADWVLTLGPEATVEAPASLRSAVIGRLRALLERYE